MQAELIIKTVETLDNILDNARSNLDVSLSDLQSLERVMWEIINENKLSVARDDDGERVPGVGYVMPDDPRSYYARKQSD